MVTPQRACTAVTKSALLGAIRKPGGTHRRDRRDSVLPGLLGHVCDRLDRPLHRLRIEPAGLLEPLAQSGDLGAVDDLAPATVRAPLADVELHRVRAHVDDRVPLRCRTRRAP